MIDESCAPETGASETENKTEQALGESAEDRAGATEENAPADEKQLSPEEALEAKCAELEAKCAELSDQYLRKAADFENYRKRSQKEKAEAIDFANQSLLLDLIPVLDDFDRALKSAGVVAGASETPDYEAAFKSLFDGLSMTGNRLYSTLENKWNLKRYDSEGQPFDPERHEALMMEKSSEVSEAVVKEEFVKGYLLKERIIRTAKVKVLMPE